MVRTIAIIGGTGPEGRGLATRFVQAGRQVILGSRQAERARSAAAEVNEALGSSLASGSENAEAARSAQLVVLAIPFAGMAEAVKPLAAALSGKSVISTIVPLVFAKGLPHAIPVREGSAAQQLQALLPDARVVAAFHHLSSQTLVNLDQPVDADVLVCGDDLEAKREVITLIEQLPGARGVDAGPLGSAYYLEAFTAVLLRINRGYRAHTSLQITHLPEPPHVILSEAKDPSSRGTDSSPAGSE